MELELSLCNRCKQDFEQAGDRLRREFKHQDYLEDCDICYRKSSAILYVINEDKYEHKKNASTK